MSTTKLIATLSTALALGTFGAVAQAETNDDMSFSGMFKMERLDKNKDGMVSKEEFLEMMGKVYDMKAKEMKVKGGKMNDADFKQVLMYLKAGG
jgi:Ca2+-binding EF-hand superfamily protein